MAVGRRLILKGGLAEEVPPKTGGSKPCGSLGEARPGKGTSHAYGGSVERLTSMVWV